MTESDVKPFGKLAGLGTLIIGLAAVLLGGCTYLSEKLLMPGFSVVGGVIMVVCSIVGIAMNICAMIKYNKGVF